MAQQQLLSAGIVPVCKEYKLACRELDIVVRRTKDNNIDIVLRKGQKALKLSFATYLAIVQSFTDIATARELLLGILGQDHTAVIEQSN